MERPEYLPSHEDLRHILEYQTACFASGRLRVKPLLDSWKHRADSSSFLLPTIGLSSLILHSNVPKLLGRLFAADHQGKDLFSFPEALLHDIALEYPQSQARKFPIYAGLDTAWYVYGGRSEMVILKPRHYGYQAILTELERLGSFRKQLQELQGSVFDTPPPNRAESSSTGKLFKKPGKFSRRKRRGL